ncbi:MAG: MATE family efflux transporter [Eubacteriaceae bacterium]|nr:MATE family efflux transporter [Eubacteriaceae bacterium]
MELDNKREYYRKLVGIGIPVVFQNLISMSLNLVDTLMIGKLGEEELAAVGAGNQVFFVFTVALFGLYSGMAVYTAQYFGAGDKAGVRRMIGMAYLIGITSSIIVMIGSTVFAEEIIGLFSREQSVIGFGAEYLKIVNWSYIFSAASFAISYNARAIQDLKEVTVINALAIGINCVLNYFLIFGVMGFPKMGVAGAAVATLIARVLELVMLLGYYYTRKEHYFKASPSQLFSFDRGLFVKAMKTALPVVLAESSWAITTSLTFAAFGKLGTSALAVSQIANVACDMLQSVFFGVGNASAMMIGEKLGQRNKDVAYSYAIRTIKVVMVLNVVMTVLLIVAAKPIAAIYSFNEPTNTLLIKSIIAMAITITPKMIAYIYICSFFRAGGDTVYCMILEAIATWLIQVPMAFLCVLVLKTSLPVAIILVDVSDVFRIIVNLHHFRKKTWLKIVTD